MHALPVTKSRRLLVALGALLIAGLLIGQNLPASESAPLIELVNAYRTSEQTCQGRRLPAAGPLAPEPDLARIEIASRDDSLQHALRGVGYAAARAQVIVLSGPRSARAAMTLLKERYCEPLMDGGYADAGISRDGRQWKIVLARPLLSADIGDWRQAGREVLDLVNDARGQARACGGEKFAAAPPVRWDAKLASTALAHSRDMASRNYFAHESREGTTVERRAERQGYDWRRIGENIATGQGSPRQVVSGWLASPTHCSNIMQPDFTEMGAAYAVNVGARTIIYWTQVFGTPAR